MKSLSPTTPPIFRDTVARTPNGPLFDIHVNLGATDTEGIGYGRLACDEYVETMTEAGVRRACVFPPLMADYHTANDRLREWATRQGDHILPFARLGGNTGPRPIRRFWQARQSLRARLTATSSAAPTIDLSGFAGIKLIPHLSGLPDAATFDAINRLGLPILVHTGAHSPPNWIAETLLPKLDTPLILAHLGAYPTEASLLADAVEWAQREPRIHLDTSGVWVSEFIRYAARYVWHKMLFGSDAPLAHPEVAWLQLASALRDDRQLEAIGWQNAERVFASWLDKTNDHD